MIEINHLLIILSLVALASVAECRSTSAYIYYQDAECVSGGDVYGTLVYAYDNSRMSGKGFKIKRYNGSCKYFEGGFYDFMYQSYSSSSKSQGQSYMQNGYCIRCNGIVGCTSTRYSCQGFSTVIPSTPYTSGYATDDIDSSVDDVTIEEEDNNSNNITASQLSGEGTYYTTDMEEVEHDIYQELLTSEKSPLYSVLGVLFGGIILVSTAWIRGKYSRACKTTASINSKSLSDSLPANEHSVGVTV